MVQGQTVGIWKLDGTAWSIVDIGTQAGTPSRVAVAATGDLFVAGEFVGAGNETSVRFAHATPTCPAAVASSGTGCTGAGGPLSLQANGLPWAGGTFAATATGLASPLALRTVGDPSPASPLPLGAPGCSLYVLPFAVDVLLPVAGSAAAGFTIPRQANLAGLVFHTQVVGIELTPTGDLMRLTSTNALALSVGAL